MATFSLSACALQSVTRPSISKKLRFRVFERDGFACVYCGQTGADTVLHADHWNPVIEGGGTNEENLVTACVACNLGKGATPPRWFMEDQRMYAALGRAIEVAYDRFGKESDLVNILLNILGHGDGDAYLRILESASSWTAARRDMDFHFYGGIPPFGPHGYLNDNEEDVGIVL